MKDTCQANKIPIKLSIIFAPTEDKAAPLSEFYTQMIAEEVNVNQVEYLEAAIAAVPSGFASTQTSDFTLYLDKNITQELAAEGFVRELIRVVQSARKKAGLNVDDRIKLRLSWAGSQTDAEVVPAAHQETLKREVLATELTADGNYAYDEIAKVEGKEVLVSLEAA